MAPPAASVTTHTARGDTARARWDTAVAELVRLRREEAAQEQAAEDALADELYWAFRGRQLGPDTGRHPTGR